MNRKWSNYQFLLTGFATFLSSLLEWEVGKLGRREYQTKRASGIEKRQRGVTALRIECDNLIQLYQNKKHTQMADSLAGEVTNLCEEK